MCRLAEGGGISINMADFLENAKIYNNDLIKNEFTSNVLGNSCKVSNSYPNLMRGKGGGGGVKG